MSAEIFLKQRGRCVANGIFYKFREYVTSEKISDVTKIKSVLSIVICGIGDMIIHMPVLSMLGNLFRKAHVVIATRAPLSELVKNHPGIDEVVDFDVINFDGNFNSLTRYAQIFDVVINFAAGDSQLSKALRAADIKHLFTNEKYYHFTAKHLIHASEYSLAFVKEIANSIRQPPIYIGDEERAFAQSYLEKSGLIPGENLLFGIHPGSGNPLKNWDWKRFVEVCNILAQDYKAKILLISGPSEHQIVSKIADNVVPPPLIAQGMSLRNIAALLEQCNMLISNDSGIMHLGASVGTSTVSIFGPSITQTWAPLGYNHVLLFKGEEVCMKRHRGGCRFCSAAEPRICLDSITVDDVIYAVKLLLTHGLSSNTTRAQSSFCLERNLLYAQ